MGDPYEDYFNMERYHCHRQSKPKDDAEAEPTKEIVLPLKSPERQRRSRSPKQPRFHRARAFDARDSLSFRFSHATGRMHPWVPGMEMFSNETRRNDILEAIQTMVPMSVPRGPVRAAAEGEVAKALEMGRWDYPPISFCLPCITEASDAKMLLYWKSLSRCGQSVYVGITEEPTRRLQEHVANPPRGRMPGRMRIVRVALTSRTTGPWEVYAIKLVRQWGMRCLNIGGGNERASSGVPHYGYILECT